MLATVAAVILVLIAALHSVLGEAALLRPLFARPWELDIPREPAERIFRFAWHLTSLAWIGLAAAVLGLSALHATALVCLGSGALVFVMLRGHLAWPLFFAVAGCIWASLGVIPALALQTLSFVGAGLAVALAGLHVYWGLGGRWGFAAALPQGEDGEPAIVPGPLPCFAVATACAALGVLLAWPSFAPLAAPQRIMLWIALVVFVARAVGDGRQVGFSKANHETAFARADDALYSPLVVGLAFACGAALLLA
ncbi:hypothetical protein PPSIR1_26888 [Plesiocystis pacifica SIR-1]|uniref:Uncharacterized protein n=1 Tax=Plesiocystis pacifica SIR-1 TaxID=391625 RepID=A6GD81_9BACT|nr:DUF3995 domain-containing protein [Plesiocystis pacifica]EDM76156.1 hypothetical protein PPSIR1_26888 [Plesiocystis pacifica SIR-1]